MTQGCLPWLPTLSLGSARGDDSGGEGAHAGARRLRDGVERGGVCHGGRCNAGCQRVRDDVRDRVRADADAGRSQRADGVVRPRHALAALDADDLAAGRRGGRQAHREWGGQAGEGGRPPPTRSAAAALRRSTASTTPAAAAASSESCAGAASWLLTARPVTGSTVTARSVAPLLLPPAAAAAAELADGAAAASVSSAESPASLCVSAPPRSGVCEGGGDRCRAHAAHL